MASPTCCSLTYADAGEASIQMQLCISLLHLFSFCILVCDEPELKRPSVRFAAVPLARRTWNGLASCLIFFPTFPDQCRLSRTVSTHGRLPRCEACTADANGCTNVTAVGGESGGEF